MRYRIDIDGHNWLDLVAEDVGDPDRHLVHVFRDDELDELARHVYAAAIGVDVDLLDDDEWRPTLDILRNHGT